MKKRIIFILSHIALCSVMGFSQPQFFEGKIKYLMLVKLHGLDNIVAELYTKGDNARLERKINNIERNSYTLFLGEDYYVVNDKYESITKNIESDSALTQSKIESFKKLKQKEKILGYDCTLYKRTIKTTYGDDEYVLSIADSLKAITTNRYMYKDLGVILKIVENTKGHVFILEAVDVIKMKLEDDLFELPNYPIKEVDLSKLSSTYVK